MKPTKNLERGGREKARRLKNSNGGMNLIKAQYMNACKCHKKPHHTLIKDIIDYTILTLQNTYCYCVYLNATLLLNFS
jgi:hypothetical protein